MSDEREEAFTKRVKQALDDSEARLDPAVTARLQTARRTALAARPKMRYWLPAGVIAAAASVYLAFNLWITAPENGLAPELADVELLADDALELYDDLEFYEWLDADAEAPG